MSNIASHVQVLALVSMGPVHYHDRGFAALLRVPSSGKGDWDLEFPFNFTQEQPYQSAVCRVGNAIGIALLCAEGNLDDLRWWSRMSGRATAAQLQQVVALATA